MICQVIVLASLGSGNTALRNLLSAISPLPDDLNHRLLSHSERKILAFRRRL